MRRRYDLDPEPCSIGLNTIVQYLERMHRPKMASFVRDMLDMEKRHARDRREWEEHIGRLLAIVYRYEPPRPELEWHRATPPPEASD